MINTSGIFTQYDVVIVR